MNALKILTCLYSRLHNYSVVPYWVLTPFRRIVRGIANCILPRYLARVGRKFCNEYKTDCVTDKKLEGEERIIVSLTSFPSRIHNVWQVIICMINQTLRPQQILLWLSKEQFATINSIPKSLRKLEGDVFKIRMVDGDIRSHKKYYYVAKEYPNDFVFLIDDDIYYPTDIIEKTWKAHLKNPEAVICNYGYHVAYNEDGSIKCYNDWKECYEESDDKDLFFGSGGGTLIRPSSISMNGLLTDINLAQKISPLADDIWLNTMTRLSGCGCHMLQHGLFLPILIKGDVRLTTTNKGHSENDVQIMNVENHFGPIFSLVLQ